MQVSGKCGSTPSKPRCLLLLHGSGKPVVDDAATFMDMDRITAAWAEEYSYPST
jgi:predicted esterase